MPIAEISTNHQPKTTRILTFATKNVVVSRFANHHRPKRLVVLAKTGDPKKGCWFSFSQFVQVPARDRGAVGSGGEWRRPATPKPQEAQLTTPLSTSRSQSESPDSEPRRQRDLRVRRPLSEGAPGLWRVLVELHACGVRFCHSVRGLAQAFACCGAGFGRGVVASIRRAQRCTPDARVRAVRGDSAHAMHSYMHFGHSSMHATRSARVRRGSCMHRRKAGLQRPSAKPTRATGLGCGPQAPLMTPMPTPEKQK